MKSIWVSARSAVVSEETIKTLGQEMIIDVGGGERKLAKFRGNDTR